VPLTFDHVALYFSLAHPTPFPFLPSDLGRPPRVCHFTRSLFFARRETVSYLCVQPGICVFFRFFPLFLPLLSPPLQFIFVVARILEFLSCIFFLRLLFLAPFFFLLSVGVIFTPDCDLSRPSRYECSIDKYAMRRRQVTLRSFISLFQYPFC